MFGENTLKHLEDGAKLPELMAFLKGDVAPGAMESGGRCGMMGPLHVQIDPY